MVPRRPGVGAATAIFVVVIVVIVGVMGLISFASQSGGGGVSSSSPTIAEQTSYSTTSPPGLQLQVELNATSISSGSALSAQLILFNPLDENLSVSGGNSSSSAIATWNGYDFLCNGYGRAWSLAGYALFRGDYSSNNFSSAGEPLMLTPPIGASCANFPSPNLFVFLPHSSNATAYYPSRYNLPPEMHRFAINATTEFCENEKTGSTYCPVGSSLLGYWSNPLVGQMDGSRATTNSSYFHYFSPGEYTLAVENIWGQTVYAHFQVTSSTSTTAYTATINGLTCPDPSYTSAAEATLISMITESPRFQAATNESLFVLGNFENLTDRMQTINGTVTHLPDALELVFYGYGPATTCVRGSGAYVNLVVQVPIEDGFYNMTGMQIITGRGPF